MIPSRKELRATCDSRFSPKIYEKLQKAQVAIAGLGGLGSNIAVMLTRTGIGRLKLIDFDRVDLSNLNRQVYDIRHLGQLKTEALSKRLREINPYIELELYNGRITEDKVESLFQDYRYICEAFDGAEDKAMLAQQVLCGLPDAYLVSGSGMAGYQDAGQIHTRKINNRFFVCGDECSDAAEGVGLMAPRVAVCAGHQANKIIQLILEERERHERR